MASQNCIISLPSPAAAALPAALTPLPPLLPPPPTPRCRRRRRVAAALPNALLLPTKSRFRQAAASADKLATTAAEALPPPRYRCLRHRRAADASNAALSASYRPRCQAGRRPRAAAALPPPPLPPLPSFPSSSSLLSSSPFPSPLTPLLLVDC